MNNYSTQTVVKQAASLTWIVDYSGELVETESHDAVKLAARDRDGRYAPLDKPVTKRKAMNKLCKLSTKHNAGMDLLAAMESW